MAGSLSREVTYLTVNDLKRHNKTVASLQKHMTCGLPCRGETAAIEARLVVADASDIQGYDMRRLQANERERRPAVYTLLSHDRRIVAMLFH